MQRVTTSAQNYRFDFQYQNWNNVHTPGFISIKSLKILQPLFHKTCGNGVKQLQFAVDYTQQR